MDIPHDIESYVHRIGRTRRAGRSGEAILFVTLRERGMLAAIEKATRQRIELFKMPSTEDINDRRVAQFKQRIADTLAKEDLGIFPAIIEQFLQERDCSPIEAAAALAHMLQGEHPLLLPPAPPQPERSTHNAPRARDGQANRAPARDQRPRREHEDNREKRGPRPDRQDRGPLERYRIEVGAIHGANPSNIVGAIANEAGLSGKLIGQIDIFDEHTTVDLPPMPPNIFNLLQNVRVAGQRLRISREGEPRTAPQAPPAHKPKPKRVKPVINPAEAARKRVAGPKKKKHRGQSE